VYKFFNCVRELPAVGCELFLAMKKSGDDKKKKRFFQHFKGNKAKNPVKSLFA